MHLLQLHLSSPAMELIQKPVRVKSPHPKDIIAEALPVEAQAVLTMLMRFKGKRRRLKRICNYYKCRLKSIIQSGTFCLLFFEKLL